MTLERGRSTEGEDAARSTRLAVGAALSLGLVLALVTSGALVVDRITEGRLGAALLANTLTTFAALLALARVRPEGPASRSLLVVTLAGAAAGVAVVHLFVRVALHGSFPWLAEQPAQFVNDAVAALATLSVAWACAKRRVDLSLVLAGGVVVAAYALTRGWWHLDTPPHAFRATVQQCVVAQFFSVAAGLLTLRGAATEGEPRW